MPAEVIESLPNYDFSAKERSILLLGSEWSTIKDGIAGVNRSLALSLAQFKGISVYSTVFHSQQSMRAGCKRDADENHVTLFSLASDGQEGAALYRDFNESPKRFMTEFKSQVPKVSHIVGHVPVSGEAAIRIRDELYPDAKVILFYHMIPGDVTWLENVLPYLVPEDNDLVRLGEKADVVYSVTDRLHWYYTAKFRNRAQEPVDHRLYLPQCGAAVFGRPRAGGSGAGGSGAGGRPTVLVLAEDGGADNWSGIDIAACGVNKAAAAASVAGSTPQPVPKIKVSAVGKGHMSRVRDKVGEFCTEEGVVADVQCYTSAEQMHEDLARCDLCVVPSRAEPFGHVGLHALSAGIPTLLAEDSSLATVVKRLTSEPEFFLVPVTPTTGAVRQDGSAWRDRILRMLSDPVTAQERAAQLRMALRRDEVTKETHDDFITFCLGGIRVQFEALRVEFLYRSDEDKELGILRAVNDVLRAALKQSWRLKHHPLTTEADLYQVLPGASLPIKDGVTQVVDKVEEYNRRIVGVDRDSGAFLVYCPTATALSDLWAMCDRINHKLVDVLLSGDENVIMEAFKLGKVTTRTVISGPEFLQYKKQLVKNM